MASESTNESNVVTQIPSTNADNSVSNTVHLLAKTNCYLQHNEKAPATETPSDLAFKANFIAWARKQIVARHACSVPGHSHCFVTSIGRHLPLDNAAIDEWAEACVSLTFTVLSTCHC